MTKKKKAEAKTEPAAKKSSAEKSKSKEKKVDLVEVRKNISGMVTDEYEEITQAVVHDAKAGQLAHVKYLFEMAGVYPAPSEASGLKLEDDSLAKTLLDRMNIPYGTVAPREGEDGRMPEAAPVEELATAKVVESEKAGETAE